MAKTKQEFQAKLNAIFAEAEKIDGISGIKIRSGNLHEIIGDYPGPDHRMPICCGAMKENMGNGDKILEDTPSGQGANISILYEIPR